jgi:hypothetical protein
MLSQTYTRPVVVSLATLFFYLAFSAGAFAQAWVPAKGDGTVSITYQKVDVRYHYTSTGAKEERGQINSHSTIMALEYGLTDKLAVDLDLAFVASKWIGQGRRPHGPLDNGLFHPMFQDAHIGLRYNALRRNLLVTPFVAVTIPTHDYEVRGHSAVGRGFPELLIGTNVGRQLDPILRDGYFQFRYSYAILKPLAGVHLNRSNADWEVGWAANRRITIRFVGSWQKTHGGFEFPQDIHDEDDFDIHDRVARVKYVQLGAGVTFSVNRSLDVHTAWAPTPIYSRNSHGDKGFIVGFSWRFSRGPHDRISANTSPGKLPTIAQGMF